MKKTEVEIAKKMKMVEAKYCQEQKGRNAKKI